MSGQRGKGKIPFSYYSYRVEFQARGLPHIHGVLWIDEEWMALEGYSKDLDKYPDVALELVKALVSVSLPEEEPLKSRVEDLQKHNHTATCKKNTKRATSTRVAGLRELVAVRGCGRWRKHSQTLMLLMLLMLLCFG